MLLLSSRLAAVGLRRCAVAPVAPRMVVLKQRGMFFTKAHGWMDRRREGVDAPMGVRGSGDAHATTSSASSSTTTTTTTTKTTTAPTTSSTTATTATTMTKTASNGDVLHEDIYTLPNILTFTRLAAAPFVGYFVLHDQHALAVGLFAYAGITDLLDGWIARKWNRQTVVGTVIDPMADKFLMTILTVCLAVKGSLPAWVAIIILGRDVALAISAIYYRWISLPPPKTFARYWDFSLPSAEVRPTTISKYNTFLQLALVGCTTAAPLVAADLSSALSVMQYVVAATTIWSGASYVYTKDAVKILNKPDPRKP